MTTRIGNTKDIEGFRKLPDAGDIEGLGDFDPGDVQPGDSGPRGAEMTTSDTSKDSAKSQPEPGSLEFYLAQIPDEFSTLEAAIARVFETGQQGQLSEERVQGWIDELVAGEGAGDRAGLTGADLEDQIRDDIARFIITKEVMMDFYGVDESTAEQLILGANEGGIDFSSLTVLAPGAEATGVMGGGDLVKVLREDGTHYFALRYIQDGIEHLYSFDSDAAAAKAVGTLTGATNMDEADVNDGDTWLLGDAAGFVGQEGDYAVYFDDIMQEAALEAGIRNPGKLGDFLAQPEVQRILAMAEAGNWSEARTQAEIRNLDYYQDVLYPGIDKIMESGEGGDNPEAVWIAYHKSVEASLDALGYERDADGSYSSLVGELLDHGIRDDEFIDSAGVFIRAEQSPEFAASLDAWIQQETGTAMTFEDMFDVLAGTSDSELDAIVEKATIQFQAEQTSLFLDPSQIEHLANMTQFSEQQIAQGFGSAEQQLLALGAQGLSRYGLTEEALINAAFNLETDGISAVETRRLATKTIRELGFADDRKAQFFQSFDPSGRPIRPGLAASAPEAG